jgi:hypothetical protein
MWYEIHVIMELTLFLYENKECMSLLSLLEKIHHTNLSLVVKKHRLQLEILICSLSLVADE